MSAEAIEHAVEPFFATNAVIILHPGDAWLTASCGLGSEVAGSRWLPTISKSGQSGRTFTPYRKPTVRSRASSAICAPPRFRALAPCVYSSPQHLGMVLHGPNPPANSPIIASCLETSCFV
jgi:hypothetical protein